MPTDPPTVLQGKRAIFLILLIFSKNYVDLPETTRYQRIIANIIDFCEILQVFLFSILCTEPWYHKKVATSRISTCTVDCICVRTLRVAWVECVEILAHDEGYGPQRDLRKTLAGQSRGGPWSRSLPVRVPRIFTQHANVRTQVQSTVRVRASCTIVTPPNRNQAACLRPKLELACFSLVKISSSTDAHSLCDERTTESALHYRSCWSNRFCTVSILRW